MQNIIFLCNVKENIGNAYTNEQIANCPVYNYEELISKKGEFRNIEYIFSTWGMPNLSEEEIEEILPKLKAVFYAAGTVQKFARPFINRGVHIFSAWAANAIPVAEFTAAQIVLANKGYFQLHNRYKQNHKKSVEYAKGFCGNYGVNVGLIGVGMISRHVITLLKPYSINIKASSNYLTDEEAKLLGVQKAGKEEIFETCQTISNHLANNEKTVGSLNYKLFSLMKENATFINTGRGAQVVLPDLIKALTDKPERTALLDVTDPTEPLPPESPLWNMPNVFLSPHRAGSAVDEIYRMGEYMFSEYKKFIRGEKTDYEVDINMLDTMA